VAEISAFYTDKGWSGGMLAALKSAIETGAPFTLRSLSGNIRLPAAMDQAMAEMISASVDVAA
jgi:hypothetical protein